ncbi:hypothetical protein D3C73_1588790 [compost metagenome]
MCAPAGSLVFPIYLMLPEINNPIMVFSCILFGNNRFSSSVSLRSGVFGHKNHRKVNDPEENKVTIPLPLFLFQQEWE